MVTNKKIVGLVGSPNRDGLTNKLVAAALEGAAREGAATELIQMSDQVVAACKDCLPWVCKDNLKCTYEDGGFEHLSRKILDCDALILGTPVYWWDTSGLVKYLILKMFRLYAPSAPLQGLPALGIAVAGGTGNGLVSGLRPVYHFFQTLQMRAIEPLPVTRFNLDSALGRAADRGNEIAAMASDRKPFDNLEERLLWYDALPYLNLSRFEERRLLASRTTQALPSDADAAIALGLARTDEMAAGGRSLDAMIEITRVYENGVRAYEKKK